MRYLAMIVLFFLPSAAAAGWLDDLPQEAKDAVIWSADHESGDMSQWDDSLRGFRYSMGGIINNDPPEENVSEASQDTAHSGSWSAKNTITNLSDGGATRLFRWGNTAWDDNGSLFPQEAYYSTWVYLPEAPDTGVFWNIFQIKSKRSGGSKPVWTLNLSCNGGECSSYFYTKENEPRGRPHNVSSPNIPVGEWFHLEMFVRQGNNRSGHLTLWINGELVTDWPLVTTTLEDHLRWSVNNYTSGFLNADSATIYYDDTAVSTQPLHMYVGAAPAPDPEPVPEPTPDPEPAPESEPVPCPECEACPDPITCPDPIPCPACPEPEPVVCEPTKGITITMGGYSAEIEATRDEPCP